jgi:probable F420-dependent oxidoreductase
MPKISLGLYGLQNWFGGDFAPVVDVVRTAENKGFDQVSITDHVVMGENTHLYPYGPFPAPLDFPWFEPLVVLSAIASATQKIRLSTGVLISPLRPAVLLAKQLATLDHMSHGRVTIGLGLGWQKEEYIASGVPWEGRYTRLDEQVKVCKQLWSQAPASFTGKTVQYDRIHSVPFPTQKGGIPIWFGLKPTDANIERMAEHGEGFIPMEQDPAKLKVTIDKLKAAFKARGRDPASLGVRVVPKPAFTAAGVPDLEGTLAGVPALLEAGVTMIEFLPIMFCRGAEDFPAFCDRIVKLKG